MRYNLLRPLTLLAIAFLTYQIILNICIIAGLSKNTAGNIAYLGMIIAAIYVFKRMRRRK